jgi:SAM-dependent methyltransferase
MDLTEVPANLERRHPWEVARASFFARVVERSGLGQRPVSLLDVGAGDGYLAGVVRQKLAPGSSATCVDALYTDGDQQRLSSAGAGAIHFARECPDQRFDVMMLLDVIEHVPDDRAFLGSFIERHLNPGGSVLISVPAWQGLFSAHDVALKHYRRYSPGAARQLLRDCALTVQKDGGLFHGLLVPRAIAVAGEVARRKIGRPTAAGTNLGQWRGGRALSAAVEGVLSADNALSHLFAGLRLSVPGLSYWALCVAR